MKIYKYQPINKNSLINLDKQKNWVADPLMFNDPFELRIKEIYDFNEKGELEYLDANALDVRNLFVEVLKSIGVVCYSNNEYDRLMWSHYADHHKGMCVVFEVPNEQMESIRPIKYKNTLPKLTFSADKKEIRKELIEIATTKAQSWEYENEYREIFYKKNIHVDYPGQIVEIVFGCRANISEIELVKSIVNPVKNKIDFSKTSIQKNSFNLGKSTVFPNNGVLDIPDWWDHVSEF